MGLIGRLLAFTFTIGGFYLLFLGYSIQTSHDTSISVLEKTPFLGKAIGDFGSASSNPIPYFIAGGSLIVFAIGLTLGSHL